MDTGGQTLTTASTGSTGSTGIKATPLKAADVKAVTPGAAALPANYGLESSFESYLNAQGVDVGGAYATLQQKFGQLPGTGETITNVSVGDLTDASMDDGEVAEYGPTTILTNGQRYLDLPSMPLIPAYVAEPDGSLSAAASVEGTGDPVLGEIGLDFSVMAPLPDADQRAAMRARASPTCSASPPARTTGSWCRRCRRPTRSRRRSWPRPRKRRRQR